MVSLHYLSKKINVLFFALLVFISFGCSTTAEKKAKVFDSSKVNNILFEFNHNPKFLRAKLPKIEIATQVAKNLVEWGYKINADSSVDYSHVLSIKMGDITHASTPAGFSFGMGNSDPRSIDFQKADVIEMTCYITAKDQPENSAELDASVIADDYLPFVKQNRWHKKLVDMLVNDTSTLCFNLLNNLKIQTEPYEKNMYSVKPGWFPDIRVEIVNDAEPEKDEPASPIENKKDEHSSSTESNKIKKTSRKRMTIHNQGSPITIKFGHERK